MKRAFIVHGWEFGPQDHWYPWLKEQLEGKGFKVDVLKMPNTKTPRINTWVPRLAKEVCVVDKNTYFIGHSIGCQAIIRFLAGQKRKAAGVICVGGWFMLTPEATPTKSYRALAEPWLKTPIDFVAARKAAPFVALLSKDDPYVPVGNAEVFKTALGAKVILQDDKGHYTAEEGVTSLPTVMKEIERMQR